MQEWVDSPRQEKILFGQAKYQTIKFSYRDRRKNIGQVDAWKLQYQYQKAVRFPWLDFKLLLKSTGLILK